MCGLFGFVKIGANALAPAEIEAGRAALHTLERRGPDQWGEHIAGGAYHGHRRLSILDLSESGRQPMTGGGGIVLTANGEIYNYKSVRAEIGKDKFRSESDSEVLLHGYGAWGMERLIERIDGMYAFALHDTKGGEIHFGRDRSGIKPLLYARLGDYFIWASELKAIAAFAERMGLVLRTDNTALFDFLTYRYIPGAKTFYKDVYNLEPAHRMVLDTASGRVQMAQYWTLPVSDAPICHDKAAERVREVLATSVEEQLVSDVPLGFFLSGGIDSSLMVALAAARHGDISTFSIGYDHKAHDETHYADIVAERFKTRHHKEILSGGDAADLPQQILDWYDQPFGDTSALPTFHVCAFARKSVTVALSGDGGDELFGGYKWYDYVPRWQKFQRPLAAILGRSFSLNPDFGGGLQARKLARRVRLFSLLDPLALQCALIDGMPERQSQGWRRELEVPKDYDALWHMRRYDRPDLPLRKRMQYIDFHTFLPDDIFTKVDRVSMAVALECRVPFMAREVIECAFSLPEDFLYKGGELKGGLKYAFKDLLPREIVAREKKGFSIPLDAWSAETSGRFQENVLKHYLQKKS